MRRKGSAGSGARMLVRPCARQCGPGRRGGGYTHKTSSVPTTRCPSARPGRAKGTLPGHRGAGVTLPGTEAEQQGQGLGEGWAEGTEPPCGEMRNFWRCGGGGGLKVLGVLHCDARKWLGWHISRHVRFSTILKNLGECQLQPSPPLHPDSPRKGAHKAKGYFPGRDPAPTQGHPSEDRGPAASPSLLSPGKRAF